MLRNGVYEHEREKDGGYGRERGRERDVDHVATIHSLHPVNLVTILNKFPRKSRKTLQVPPVIRR
jgi:hypothetical protein